MRKRTRKPNGHGSIFKSSSGDWRGYVTIGYDKQGKQIKKWISAQTQEEALQRLQSIKHLTSDRTIYDHKITLSEWLSQYIQQKALSVRSKTTKNHKDFLNHVPAWLGEKRLNLLTQSHLQHFHNSLAIQGLKKSYRLQIYHFIKAALEAAQKRGLMQVVPEVELPSGQIEPVAKTWTSEQVETFLVAIASHRLYPLFRLMLERGLRLGEALSLRWQDLDGDMLHIKRTMASSKGDASYNPPKTKRGFRSFNLSPELIALLGIRQEKSKTIFTSKVNRHLHPDCVRLTFKKLVKRAGVPNIRVHDLRHTFITLAREQGLPVEMVAYIAGQDVKTTLGIYSQATPSRVKAACEQFTLGGNHAKNKQNT